MMLRILFVRRGYLGKAAGIASSMAWCLIKQWIRLHRVVLN